MKREAIAHTEYFDAVADVMTLSVLRCLWQRMVLVAAVITVFAAVGFAATQPATQKAKRIEKPKLLLSIRCLSQQIKAGDEIPIEFHIKNDGETTYTYMDRNYDRSGRMDEYRLIAKDAKGRAVPDPREKRKGGLGGGLAREGKLNKGKFFTKTIALNRWTLITKPGKYQVTGIYRAGSSAGMGGSEIRSKPITIVVAPRKPQEMAAYITRMSTQLMQLQGSEGRKELIQKLMYTCDRRIIPALLDSMYKHGGFWEVEAFRYYLPQDRKTRDAILAKARINGLATGMSWLLTGMGCGDKEICLLIPVSLAPQNTRAWAAGALAAQRYTDDKFTGRLIDIASNKKNNGWRPALYALAFNRTNESVEFLRKMLNHPDKEVRSVAESAVRSAYLYRSNTDGRPLKKDDFPEEYQRPKK